MAGQAMTLKLTDATPEPEQFDCPQDYVQSENPELRDLLQASFENLLQYQVSSISRSYGMFKTTTNLIQRAIDPGKSFGAFAQTAPRTPFNQTITQDRSYACVKLPFQEVRKIGKSMGASINDVFLTICSGALRRNLLKAGHLPEENLLAGCPVAVPKQGNSDQGNSVTLMTVDLFTNVKDPRVRLLKVKNSSHTAKEVTSEMADALDNNTSLLGLPALTRAASLFGEASGAANTMPMPCNVLISNVPGPRETLYSNGAKMLSHYPVSIPAHGLGLNITVQSYTDGLYVGLTACPKAAQDVKALRDDLIASFQELRGIVTPTAVTEIQDKATSEPIINVKPPLTNTRLDSQVA